MSDLPPPPVPPDCDLRGLDWMPLHGARLFASDFDAIASDAEYRAAMRLWWASWQTQVPAASLPDDDRVLAHLAGLGRDLKAWRKIRDGALYGYSKCADGRLYHLFLAEAAIIAWKKRLKERARKAAFRAELAARASNRQSASSGAEGTQEKTVQERGCPAGQDADGTRLSALTETGTETVSKKDSDPNGSAASGAAAAPIEGSSPSVPDIPPPLSIREALWRDGIPILHHLTGKSDRACRAFLGKLLKASDDDCDRVYRVLHQARMLGPAEPGAWLMRACGGGSADDEDGYALIRRFTRPTASQDIDGVAEEILP